MSLRQIQLNPKLKTATWENIRDKRNALEIEPIITTHGTFDADRDALMRMDSALAAFLVLPTLTVDQKLGWKTYDNQVVYLSQVELQEVRNEVAKRAATLHYQASIIAQGSYTVGDLDNGALWGA